ncbi:MAG: glycosyltransferase family 4 protein [Vicinamibacterales bacterium]|nr:glycosyltransferase family 4 protein [Vicinamibacterales bacterium]
MGSSAIATSADGALQETVRDILSVVHLVPALFGAEGIVGGAERYAFELARHMADEVPTRLVTFGERAETLQAGKLDVRVLSDVWRVRGQRTNPWSLSAIGEILHADVVHCHQQHILMSSTAAAVCRLTGRRVFATDLGGGGWDVSAYVSTDRWFHGQLHISQYSREVFGQADNPRARVILGGVDSTKFTPDPSIPRGGTALFVGRLLPHKGVSDLIAALPERMSLDIIGPRDNTGYAQQLRAQASGKDVRFRDDCDDQTLVDAYRRALCVVLPSVYRTPDGQDTKVPELLGQTLLEAMACGTPVICTRVASMPEIVEDGRTGFIVEPGDTRALGERLCWLAGHPAEAFAMGAEGRRVVLERFQWAQVVQRCFAAYSSVGTSA